MGSLPDKRYARFIIIFFSKISLKRVLPRWHIRIYTIKSIVNHTF